MPRMSFLPDDQTIVVNGVPHSDVLVPGVPAGLHALQLFEDGSVEVEWVDPLTGQALENRFDTVGLPGGAAFLQLLLDRFAAWTPPPEPPGIPHPAGWDEWKATVADTSLPLEERFDALARLGGWL